MKNRQQEELQRASKETIIRSIGGMLVLIIILQLLQTIFIIIGFFK